jgi:predicted Zn finger-like uncharacterized protein
MILTCPECATSYFVDDSRIAAAGRVVKCSNCGARWTAMPAGAEPAPAAAAPSAPAAPVPAPAPAATPAVDELVIEGPLAAEPPFAPRRAAARPRREANGKVLVLAGSALAAAALIAMAIVFRAQVVRLMPASQAAYAGLGLPVASLVIEQVRADAAFQGGRAVLSVTGQIRNLRADPAVAPALRVSLLDRMGKPVATKIAWPINAAVPAHAVRHFAISIVDPPANVRDLEVAFDAAGKGGSPTAKAQVQAPVGPQPADAQPLPPGSPDALPPPR